MESDRERLSVGTDQHHLILPLTLPSLLQPQRSKKQEKTQTAQCFKLPVSAKATTAFSLRSQVYAMLLPRKMIAFSSKKKKQQQYNSTKSDRTGLKPSNIKISKDFNFFKPRLLCQSRGFDAFLVQCNMRQVLDEILQ